MDRGVGGGRDPVDEVLPVGKMAVFGLQHVLAMYAGVIAVPLIIASAIGLPEREVTYITAASFFVCGVATLIQSVGFWRVGIRLPIVQGTSFVTVSPMIAIGGHYGLKGIYGSVIAAGVFGFLISPYYSKLLRFFPPVVSGSVITVIGLSLTPVAIGWAAGGQPGQKGYGAPENILVALITLVLVLAITRFFGGFIGRIAVLLGLVIGTVIAAFFGMVDISGVGKAGWFGVTTPFHYGLPTFHLVPIVTMMLAMLVIMVETTSDMLAIGEIVGKPLREGEEERLADGLRADSLSTVIGGVLNTYPFSAFAQNVGLVRYTNLKSRFIVAAGGVILVLLGLFPKFAALVTAIPLPVLGGAGLVLFGTVAASGVQTLSRVDLSDNRNITIVAVSLALGILPGAAPTFYDKLPEWVQVVFGSGITSASIAAIVLNVGFHILGGGTGRRPAPATEAVEHAQQAEEV
ncbi:MAG: purine permease [Rubrobacteraceae bacterium]|nr:purine permease [Rubrobacteraceae bacterium]